MIEEKDPLEWVLERMKDFQDAARNSQTAEQQAATTPDPNILAEFKEATDTAGSSAYRSYTHRCRCKRCPRCGGYLEDYYLPSYQWDPPFWWTTSNTSAHYH